MAVNSIPQSPPFTASFKESLLKIPDGDGIQSCLQCACCSWRLSFWICHGLSAWENDRLDAGRNPG